MENFESIINNIDDANVEIDVNATFNLQDLQVHFC